MHKNPSFELKVQSLPWSKSYSIRFVLRALYGVAVSSCTPITMRREAAEDPDSSTQSAATVFCARFVHLVIIDIPPPISQVKNATLLNILTILVSFTRHYNYDFFFGQMYNWAVGLRPKTQSICVCHCQSQLVKGADSDFEKLSDELAR